jgi:hypothetical protein
MIPTDFPIPTVYRSQEASDVLLTTLRKEKAITTRDFYSRYESPISRPEAKTVFLNFACIGFLKRCFEAFEYLGILYMMDKKRTCGDTVSFYHLQQASKRTPISSLSSTHDPVSFFRAQSYVSIEMNTTAMNCQNSTLDPSQKYRRVGFTIRVPGYFSVKIVALRLFLDCDHLDWSLRLP